MHPIYAMPCPPAPLTLRSKAIICYIVVLGVNVLYRSSDTAVICDPRLLKAYFSIPFMVVEKVVGMIRKYHNHTSQTNPCTVRKSHRTFTETRHT